MKGLLCALALLFVPVAYATPPSQAQIDRLLQVMEMQNTMDGIFVQMESATRDMGTSMLGPEASAEDRARLDRILAEQNRFMREALAWDQLAPIYHRIYTELFSAEEVQAMIDFYTSQHGHSIMQKMPQVMGLAIREMQPIMQALLQETRQTMEQELQRPPAADPGADAAD